MNNNEFGFKDFVKLSISSYKLFRSNVFTIAAVSVTIGIVGFLISISSKPKYKAELRFVVKSEGTGYGLSGMLGGIGSVFGSGSIGSSLERTIEIISSDRIVGSTLLSKIQFDGKTEVLANVLIKVSSLENILRSDSSQKDIFFLDSDSSIEKMNFANRRAIKKLEAILIPKSGNGIISKTFDKKSGIVTISTTHENEEFAILLTREIFNKLRDFYVEQMTTSSSNNVLILQKKVDSIGFELGKVQSLYARKTDQTFGLLFQEDKVDLKKLNIREQMLMAMYAEAQKNLETFKFMNESAIPTLTVIDIPYSPLKKIEKSKVVYAIGGFFIGGFMAFLIISIRRCFKNLMAS